MLPCLAAARLPGGGGSAGVIEAEEKMPATAQDAMGYVTDSLKGEQSIQDRLQCVSRLRVIARAWQGGASAVLG